MGGRDSAPSLLLCHMSCVHVFADVCGVLLLHVSADVCVALIYSVCIACGEHGPLTASLLLALDNHIPKPHTDSPEMVDKSA